MLGRIFGLGDKGWLSVKGLLEFLRLQDQHSTDTPPQDLLPLVGNAAAITSGFISSLPFVIASASLARIHSVKTRFSRTCFLNNTITVSTMTSSTTAGML